MAQEKKAAPDWERIEADYRAGLLSVREIAASQGITEGAIRKRAKRDDWIRDLRSKIHAKADDLVRKQEVRSEVRTEKAVIDSNAQAIVDVRLSHRVDIVRAKKLTMSLLAELEHQTENIDLFRELGELMFKPDDKGIDKLNEIYNKVISLGSRTGTMKQLSDSLRTLIGLEREAYGISGDPIPDNRTPSGLKHFYGDSEADA
ncbi:hypothetical protein [Neopusillimonas maritima]|uniref:Phage protein n=1 Tax=Neopusillimonas maritima TaxID=2026239 RepID=A0A3A1YYH5_9BURK|nr:hypothetical protein [Neopusillimonas maritima]RIY42595.1 hypothetical protein CJP73_00500 [Neopusillimonas maritima]